MNGEKIGAFIARQRKSRNMTQKELAQRLNITDKAVSKWERGLSYPDISLLAPLAELLGVTVSELLDGEEERAAPVLPCGDQTERKKTRNLRKLFAAAFSLSLLLGMIICVICDLAISGKLTWSLFPVSAIIFAFPVFFPAIAFERRGILGSLIALSALIVPFLYVLDRLIGNCALLLPIGVRMAAIGVLYLWAVFALFQRLKSRKPLAAGIALLLAIPVCLLINVVLSSLVPEARMDVWDVLAFLVMAAVSLRFFALDRSARRREEEKIPAGNTGLR